MEVEEIKYIFSSLFASCTELSDGKRVPHSVTSSHNTQSSKAADVVVQFQKQMWFEFLCTWAWVPMQTEVYPAYFHMLILGWGGLPVTFSITHSL